MKLDEYHLTLATIVSTGVIIAIGKLLNSGEKITLRILLGRVILGGGLSASAGAILAIYPNLPLIAIVGVASALGILGQSFIEMFINKYLKTDK